MIVKLRQFRELISGRPSMLSFYSSYILKVREIVFTPLKHQPEQSSLQRALPEKEKSEGGSRKPELVTVCL